MRQLFRQRNPLPVQIKPISGQNRLSRSHLIPELRDIINHLKQEVPNEEKTTFPTDA